jgi:AcrR family transcriptional regulator
MTQKISFTKEMIVEVAFSLTRELGWSAVTARSIAKKLGSSTMPIYSSMRSMEEIEQEVRKKGEKLMFDYQKRSFTDNPMLNMAIGYVTFARDEQKLFRFLFVDRPVAVSRQDVEPEPGEPEPGYAPLNGVVTLADQAPTAMKNPLVLKNWIFTHGLASMISAGVLDLADERIRSLLEEAGGAFYKERKERRNE